MTKVPLLAGNELGKFPWPLTLCLLSNFHLLFFFFENFFQEYYNECLLEVCQNTIDPISTTLLFDFINLTQVHNFTVSAQDILPPVDFGIYRKLYRNFASTNADNEPFCTVLLASQVVMIHSLQPKGHEYESTCVLFFYLYSIHLKMYHDI